MVATSLEKNIKSAMGAAGASLCPDMLSKCVAIATNFKIEPTTLAEEWEALALSQNYPNLTEHTFNSFRARISKHNAKSILHKTPIKRAAIVSRPAMNKRATPKLEHDLDAPNAKRPKTPSSPDPKGTITTNNTSSSSGTSSVVVTPTKPNSKSSSIPPIPPPSVSYDHRSNSGQVILTYNPQNLAPIPKPMNDDDSTTQNKRLCTISQPFDNHITATYKHMTDVTRHTHLNDHLQHMTETMIQTMKIPMQDHDDHTDDNEDDADEEHTTMPSNALAMYENVGVPRQCQHTNIGRVCNEAHTGKLNDTTLLIEGSRDGSNGARISLDVSKLEAGYSLFQGQIVAVSGYNHSGRKMVVEKLVEGIDFGMEQSPNMVKTSKNELKMMQYGQDENCQGGSGVKVYAVAGPYTTSQNLDYQPLVDLLAYIEDEQPDVVVLMGPFVDTRQDLVKSGEHLIVEYGDGTKSHVSYEQFFAAKVSNELEALYEALPDLKTQFVIVPSLDDAIAEPVYPQPPLEDQLPNGGKVMKLFPETQDMPFGSLCLDNVERAGGRRMPKNPSDRRIHLVSNPSTIRVNEVTIGFTSTDTLMHLSMESINHKLPPGSRLTRLAEHHVKQQSYYPIFPPPSAPGREVNLDLTKNKAYDMPVQPDVLILPSRLTSTAMDIAGGTTVVNPGHLVKGAMGGSFAVMDIHPMKIDTLEGESDEEIGHDVQSRIRVEVRRI